MKESADIERLEILLPALYIVHRDSSGVVVSPSDDHCAGVGILQGTGTAVIKVNKKLNFNLITLQCLVFKTESFLLAPVCFDQSSCIPAP